MIFIDKKFLLCTLVIAYSLTGVVHSCYAGTNLALSKPYTVSSPPSYTLSAPSTDKTSLTDGNYTKGYFWTQKTTVGWQGIKNIEILIDLEKMSTIDSISFSTARGTNGDVHYPSHIAVFAGTDKDKLLYVGDIAKDSDSPRCAYETRRLTLNDIGVKGRYVLLEAQPKGLYLFCDEIEVIEGVQNKGKTGNLSLEDARSLFEELKGFDIYEEFENKLTGKLKSGLVDNMRLIDRLAKIRQIMTTLPSLNDVDSIEAEILKLRYDSLRAQLPGKQLLIETINPWAALSPVFLPSGVPTQGLSFTIPQGGYDHTAITITNLSPKSEQVSLLLDRLPEEVPELLMYEVPFVKCASTLRSVEFVADPLVPLKRPVVLKSGELKMFLLTAHGKKQGTWQTLLKVDMGGIVTSIPIKSQISTLALPKHFTLNSVNWGYLDFASIRTRKTEAVNDLFAHHTNVIVVPPEHLPLADPEKPLDFSRLETYLTMHRGASKVMFFMNYRSANVRTGGGRFQYLDEKWKEAFLGWYERAIATAVKAGFQQEQVYLFPYDEMSENEVEDFISLAKWAKKEIPGIKFYATLNNVESLRVLPYLDISQVVDRDYMLADVPGTQKDLWLYSARGPAKSLSPYSYYRMMSWKAFLLGFNGVGFWAYADTGGGDNPGTAWDDFDGKYPDYAVIYEGEGNTIISSRRWEAWRMGIEDYELLTMYSKVKGDKAAKALAKEVLDNPNDLSMADEVRRKILIGLSN